ncbi:ABC transporter substrate-binding protein [Moraxella catarrhalis]|uniref:Hydroxymethylpyrimidine ABC transporter, substrate-binding component n=1 Tax=Moraxella catarrhalis TaxID=480 RepID=A0A198UGG9_MORCA|nr:ABC transporter substrate-binding protein [Moraxella catarrhalis]OAU95409.1 Hydroxymethylpyrimidine ABC transporter, substrate-binding component [Moraxella catarrhalis]OAU98210.1 Hydroxymethylpyrimidine ABC transporter, substrate-binding component [Moraxella catarrhalis]OAV02777.1 Hydroxymethylpyrimidine ABC transporter, substrate-binding component [Moraxella catarrhalis]
MKMFSFRPLVSVTLAAVLGLSLNACSKDQSVNEPKLQELIIALDWVPNTNHTGLYVALDQGYFKEAGFDAKIVQPSEDSTSTLVANKRADFGVYFQPNMVKRLNKGEPITAVAAITQHSSAGLLSLAELGAVTPQDLQGKRYSTWEDPVDDAVVEQVVGAPLNKIPGESTDATTALRMNQFDYIMAYYSWDGIHAGIKGVDTNFFYLKDADPVFDYYAPLLIANNDALKNNPEKYKKALAAIKQGYLYAAHHPDESAEILVKHAPEINVELAKKSQAYISPQYLDEQGDWGRFDYDRWDRFFNWVYQKGLMDEFTPKAGVTNDYLTQ